jgi:hypothetical protein
MVANGWLYDAIVIATIAGCILARGALMRSTLIAIPVQFALVHALKFLFGRVRPVNGGDAMLFAPISTIHDSFPSGHAMLLFTLTVLIAARNRILLAPCLCVTLIYCWLRIHTAAHFGSDILAGALLGSGVALSAIRIVSNYPQTDQPRQPVWPPIVVALGAVVFGAALAWPRWHRPPMPAPTEAQLITATLYTEILDRLPDNDGLAVYSKRLELGVPVTALLREIIGSDEFRRNLKTILSPEDRLHDVYRRLLNRAPTPEEIARDAPLITSTTRTDGRLELLIFRLTFSDEYQNSQP